MEKTDLVIPKEYGIFLKEKAGELKTIENLSKDLKNGFPNMDFSLETSNIHFAKEYPDFAIEQQVVAPIPWDHNILIQKQVEEKKNCKG